ncbi:MAG: hypothetical protein CL927_15880 [Deltaproteobacteria bacterium]|nr:hypothetical protein [Deltaproteobacteria bacterium]HCH63258.1 hypothetical protein [Deltaproteobacteria bacterium]
MGRAGLFGTLAQHHSLSRGLNPRDIQRLKSALSGFGYHTLRPAFYHPPRNHHHDVQVNTGMSQHDPFWKTVHTGSTATTRPPATASQGEMRQALNGVTSFRSYSANSRGHLASDLPCGTRRPPYAGLFFPDPCSAFRALGSNL